jgi:hypothetical protein
VYTGGPERGTDVDKLRYVLAAAAAAIFGLLAYGLAPWYAPAWGVAAAVVAFAAVTVGSTFVFRPDDRDPTIRPSNVPRKRG